MSLRCAAMVGGTRVVIGFRSGGQASIYCGEEPVFQFNGSGELRRVYDQGQRYAADAGRLVHLQRIAKVSRLQLVPQPISGERFEEIAASWRDWYARICQTDDSRWLSPDGDAALFLQRLNAWLPGKADLVIASTANA
ncbi:hypothetical protein Pla52n_63320 [Stieleria varia]|uniref:Uncharacterized protein n=2 Tax=Stieleria varia TaxID=2528005 RepID=A0A5C5ZY02_9BACT|nr:hypothetical protein Pla52n_63320 [Stieleria varia]